MAVPARPAVPSLRRCAPSPPASWSCRGRCPPRAAARAAPATCPVPRSAAAPLGDLLVRLVDFRVHAAEEHQLRHRLVGGAVVLHFVDEVAALAPVALAS